MWARGAKQETEDGKSCYGGAFRSRERRWFRSGRISGCHNSSYGSRDCGKGRYSQKHIHGEFADQRSLLWERREFEKRGNTISPYIYIMMYYHELCFWLIVCIAVDLLKQVIFIYRRKRENSSLYVYLMIALMNIWFGMHFSFSLSLFICILHLFSPCMKCKFLNNIRVSKWCV